MEWKQGQWFKSGDKHYRCVVLDNDCKLVICAETDRVYRPDNMCYPGPVPCDPPEYVWPKPMPVAGSIVETEDGRRWMIQQGGSGYWYAESPNANGLRGCEKRGELLEKLPGWRIVGHIDDVGKKEDVSE